MHDKKYLKREDVVLATTSSDITRERNQATNSQSQVFKETTDMCERRAENGNPLEPKHILL